MSKLSYYIGGMIAASVLVPIAFAQSFTFNAPSSQKEKTSTSPYSAEPQPVTTPENFKSGVEAANKEIQTKLTQQMTQSLKPVPAAAPKAPPPPPPKPDENTTTTTANTPNKTQQKSIKPRQMTLPGSQPTVPTKVAPSQPSVASPPPASQPPPYTGFGTQTPPSQPPSQPANTGLNIQY